MTRKRIAHVMTVYVLLAVLIGLPASALASAELEQESWGTQFAYGAASAFLSVVHVPLKVALCGTTAVLSGLAYLVFFGGRQVATDAADAVKAGCGGPYIISPQRLWTQAEGKTQP